MWYELDSPPPRIVQGLGEMAWYYASAGGYHILMMFRFGSVVGRDVSEPAVYFGFVVEAPDGTSHTLSSRPLIVEGEEEPEDGWLAYTYLLIRWKWMQRYDLKRFRDEYAAALLEDDFWDQVIPDEWNTSILFPVSEEKSA